MMLPLLALLPVTLVLTRFTGNLSALAVDYQTLTWKHVELNASYTVGNVPGWNVGTAPFTWNVNGGNWYEEKKPSSDLYLLRRPARLTLNASNDSICEVDSHDPQMCMLEREILFMDEFGNINDKIIGCLVINALAGIIYVVYKYIRIFMKEQYIENGLGYLIYVETDYQAYYVFVPVGRSEGSTDYEFCFAVAYLVLLLYLHVYNAATLFELL